MTRLKSIVTSALVTTFAVITMAVTALVMSDIQSVPVEADEPALLTTEQVEYLPLTDAVPQRDITIQQFAPSQIQ